jgi:hypothetical protein
MPMSGQHIHFGYPPDAPAAVIAEVNRLALGPEHWQRCPACRAEPERRPSVRLIELVGNVVGL